MKVLITAGATEVPIDQVRCISNIFKGKTGWNIAKYLLDHGCQVKLLTSNILDEKDYLAQYSKKYRTFDDLKALMETEITTGNYDVIIHSAAVSDYQIARIFNGRGEDVNKDRKIGSSHDSLFLELTPTIKLVDQIRQPWGFKGHLIKFKLQVGITDDELLAIAKKSVEASEADHIVANCLEWAHERAYLMERDGRHISVIRDALPAAIYHRLTLPWLAGEDDESA